MSNRSVSADIPGLGRLKEIFADLGCSRILYKLLAENDNSKNQIYLGTNFEVLNIFPNLNVRVEEGAKKAIFKAALNFSWIDVQGNVEPATHAQLILYPQYPEVRFSGFLRGCKNSPSELLNCRMTGRILLLGIKNSGEIYGFAIAPDSPLARELQAEHPVTVDTVFQHIPLVAGRDAGDSRILLLRELKRIHEKEWLLSKRLNSDGGIVACQAPNCGGYTLEAELGVRPNGFSQPDYLGWEVKQFSVPSFSGKYSGILTLMTPEPDGGDYCDKGVDYFVRTYGYVDTKGRDDRLNFGGIYRNNMQHSVTGLRLGLVGYSAGQKILDGNGSIALFGRTGQVAASWSFAGLMTHWNRKHAQAVYVPSMKREQPLQYCYGGAVYLAVGTDFLRFLGVLAKGGVYYDPGIKIEKASTGKPKIKRRSQFRVKFNDLAGLYSGGLEKVDLKGI